jgi:Clp amino terminal domain, pathogenicity island component
MNAGMFERFDPAARQVLEAAWAEAASLEDGAVATEHLLLALATADAVTATLLAEAGSDAADLRQAVKPRCDRRGARPRDHDRLLATLGIDLAQVRRRAEQTFGADAVARAASRARRRRPRRPLWSWISCSKPLPGRRCDSPLTGQWLDPIPRVKRVLDRATRAARPRPASPGHLLLALLAGDEPACEILTALNVNLEALAAATRQWLAGGGTAGERAG